MNAIKSAMVVVTLLVGTLGSNLANAGAKSSAPVTVNPSTASGSLGGARNSANSTEYIGCSTSWSATQGATVTCSGRDAGNESFSCSTDDPGALEAARSINGDSYLHVVWNALGQCTYLAVYNASQYQPKN
jgi:hypothetical protein